MSKSNQPIDLSLLPSPTIVDALSFEQILSDRTATLLGAVPEAQRAEYEATLELESEPMTILLQENAYRELVLRARVNDAARGVMLAFASGADLDQIGANYNVERLLIQAGNPQAIPPVLDVYEPDEEYRARIPLSLEGYTTAGSQGSYEYHGLSADGNVKDVDAISTTPGRVNVYVLSRTGDGTASAELLSTVSAALNARDVRPMTDQLIVQSASIVTYAVTAELVLFPGPAADVVVAAATAAVQKYVGSMHRIGYDVARSGIFQAIHLPGMVQNVTLTSPSADVEISDGQAAYCTDITITVAEGTNV